MLLWQRIMADRKLKVTINTLGCKVNQFESASFASSFLSAGCEIVSSTEADIFVLNSCAVTEVAARQSRQLLRKVLRTYPEAKVVVTGCCTQVEKEKLLAIDERVIVVGNSHKHLLAEIALARKTERQVWVEDDLRRKKKITPLVVQGFHGRTRSPLRVQDGCDNFCSYCIIPFCRGTSRSSSFTDLQKQVDILQNAGCREVIITGINVGKYGLDLTEGLDIYHLLAELCRLFPEVRFRLSSIEPPEVTNALVEVATSYANFMPHFHIPLQSGDDCVLARMNRNYTADYFRTVVGLLKKSVANVIIGCDVMVGFPGESKKAADNTFKLLSEVAVDYLHVFPYSVRCGTKAATFAGQVSKEEKNKRARRLRKLSDKKRLEFYKANLGRAATVLVEGRNKKSGLLQGFSENYIPVVFAGGDELLKQVVEVNPIDIRDNKVWAELA